VLTADDVLTARFSETRFRPGYRQDEVDRFLDRVAGTLRARSAGGWPADAVTSEELARAAFGRTSVMPGYEIAEVNAFLAEVAATLAASPAVPSPSRRVDGTARVAPPRAGIGRFLAELVVGERPDRRPAKVPRVRRVAARFVRVDAAGVHWRTWRGVSGTVPASSIAAVELLEVVLRGRVDVVSHFALVLDRSGGALLRIGMGWSARQWRTPGSFRVWLTQVWTPLSVPVTWWSSRWRRVKDARRRWPEAFSFGHAYPYWTAILVVGGYCAIVGVLDPLLRGR